MSQHGVSGRKKLIVKVLLAALLPSLVFLAAALSLLHQKYALFYLLAAITLSVIAVFALTGRYHGLNTLFSMIIGIPGGVVFVLLYGEVFAKKGMNARGWIVIAAWLLVSLLLGFLIFHFSKKAAGLHPDVERKKAIQIVLAGALATIFASLGIMAYLAKLARVLE